MNQTHAGIRLLAGFLVVALVGGCRREAADKPAASVAAPRPNILFVVWDTVRVDRLGLYGYDKPTTPNLQRFARDATVFENCVSAGSTTVPSHASMFTGLLPAEHGASNEHPRLDPRFVTLAESLRDAGYATYAFTENPHLCRETRLTQGFDVVEHPWSPPYAREALRISLEKRFPGRDIDALLARLSNPDYVKLQWKIKAAGTLAQRGLTKWLASQSPNRPFFAFINYMEAHRPLIPRKRFRERFMTPEQLRQSYRSPRSFGQLWAYCFRLRDAAPGELALSSARYDAAVAELDALFGDLIERLDAAGHLDNTVIVLVSDHGEQLGEHHLLDHQFSVYEPLMRIPLVVRYPPRFQPGRERRPVSNLDLYPTLLELAGLQPAQRSTAVSLLHPRDKRLRIGQYPAPMTGAFKIVRKMYPRFDPTPWRRSLIALYDHPYKLIAASDGRDELYDLSRDPAERDNLLRSRPDLAGRLRNELRRLRATLHKLPAAASPPERESPALLRRLEQLGYAGSADEQDDQVSPAATRPATRPARRTP